MIVLTFFINLKFLANVSSKGGTALTVKDAVLLMMCAEINDI